MIRLVKHELQGMRKETVMIYFQHFSVETQGYDKKPEAAGVPAVLRTSHLPNTSPKRCRLNHLPRQHGYLFIYLQNIQQCRK
jgi:hypothetical protein